MDSSENNKPLEFYLSLDYPITLYPEEAGGFTVEIKDLPGCLSQGETVEEAYEMIAEARELWIESCYEDEVPIPLPHTMATYSGKTMLRMPTYLHERLARSAKREGVSLNQYLVSVLSEQDALRGVKDELASIREYVEKKEPVPAVEASAYLVSEPAK